MDHTLFQGWSGLERVAIVGVAAYLALVLMLRVSGKRSLAKLNAFDLVVTVALGSTLATTLLSKTVALAEGVAAFAVLLLMQYAIAWGGTRSDRFQRLVSAPRPCCTTRGFFSGRCARPGSRPRSCGRWSAAKATRSCRTSPRSCSRATVRSAS